jgi:ribosome-binding factor A
VSSFRKERVSDEVLAVLAEGVRRMSDPRLEYVTLTGIKMSPDLKTARVFWTTFDRDSKSGKIVSDSFPGDERIAEVKTALKHASGLLKRDLGETLRLRYVPQLIFDYDESTERGFRIESLLHKIGY